MNVYTEAAALLTAGADDRTGYADTTADRAWALREIAGRQAQYQLYQDYYEGRHRLAFATAKFREAFAHLFYEFADNYCEVIVNATADRLQIEGFTAAADDDGAAPNAEADDQDNEAADATVKAQEQLLQRIWDRNDMDKRAGEVHLEATLMGDGYLIVWHAPGEPSRPVLWPQLARDMAVHYSEDEPDVVAYAAKCWRQEDGKYRLTMYYPDRLERWVTGMAKRTWPKDAAEFEPYLEDDEPVVPNPHGVVPVFHFGNNARTNGLGRSELANVIPIQDALNKTILDMLVAGEFTAMPQRWATGIEKTIDPTTGKPMGAFRPGGMWIAGRPDARFGEFPGNEGRGFIDRAREFKADMARITSTPLHVVMLDSDAAPSGEALKTAETPLTKKIEDRQRAYGSDWARAMVLALRIAGAGEHRVYPIWSNASPRTEREAAEVATMKKPLGVSERQNLRELGYSDEDIDRMVEERDEEPGDVGRALLAYEQGNVPGARRGATPGQPAGTATEADADDIAKRATAVGVLIRAGYEPAQALAAVGLDPIKHLGLLPITLMTEAEMDRQGRAE